MSGPGRVLKYGSLFSGIGGFDLGLDRAGWECAWQVEIDSQCRDVLRYHWPDVPKHEDVTDVGESDLDGVDLVCGGFPCQDLSVAGRRAGLAGERSGLFYEFMRVVGEIAPRWVLIENVPGLLSSNEGRDMGAVVGTLAELGYWWTYGSLDTQYWGPPQRRERVFVVGHLGAPCPPEVLLEPESLPWNPPPSREAGKDASAGAGDGPAFACRPRSKGAPWRGDGADNIVAIGGDRSHALTGEGCDASEDGTGRGTPVVAYRASEYRTGAFTEDDKAAELTEGTDQSRNGIVLPIDTTQITSKGNYSRPKPGDPCHPLAKGAHPPSIVPLLEVGARTGKSTDDPRAGSGIGSDGDPMYSLQATKQHGVTTAVPRRITPREAERLQGFLDDWTRWGIGENGEPVELADTPRYRMLGNAVSVPVAVWIARRVLEHSDTL